VRLSPARYSLVTLALAASLSGCHATMITSGMLSGGSGKGTECSPAPRGGVLTDGFTALEYSGTGPAVILSVTLASPRNLRLLGAWVVPVTGHVLYGVRSGWPPAWARRTAADGDQIPASAGTQVSSLLLVVQPGAGTGTAAGVRVSYRTDGQVRQFQTQIRLVVPDGGTCPG
jgi:hypothetical protein